MRRNTEGFTIVELMIAISILSVILLISSEVLVGIGNLLSKGANLANVQDTARSIVEDVTSTIQFSGNVINDGLPPTSPVTASYTPIGHSGVYTVYAYCFGNIRYSFVTGFPPSWWPHVLWKDEMAPPDSCAPLDIGEPTPTCDTNPFCSNSQSTGFELAGANMHLGNFAIGEVNPQLYTIFVGLEFGTEDLLVGYPTPTLVPVDGPSYTNYECNNTSGQQYCSTSFLSTFATERLQE